MTRISQRQRKEMALQIAEDKNALDIAAREEKAILHDLAEATRLLATAKKVTQEKQAIYDIKYNKLFPEG